ncbi:MAG TPA: trigger factor [Candidatus Limnocylindria bacterium]|nr:trigger factor [Candidatus Limnocylindria bacterium]
MAIDYIQTPLRLEIKQTSATVCSALVIVPAPLVDIIYKQVLLAQQATVQAHGFRKGTVPLDYIAQNFKTSLLEHLKEFLFNYFVLGFLHDEMRAKKFLVAGEPRLASMKVEPQQDGHFTFDVNIFPTIPLQEWKYLPFKAPKRKKYKDLDRQVDSFVKDELSSLSTHASAGAQIGDWLNFDIQLVDQQHQPLILNHHENLWLKLGDEEADKPLRDLFVDKHIGVTFYTNCREMQAYFSRQIDTNYTFAITINDILHNSFFCIDQFKRFFKLKTNKDVYQKLIEVFSYRNDLSQRRSMAEESLKLLISKHRFDVPNYLILRQQKKVLDAVQHNPDYHVYRMQKDFTKRVQQLAEKQTREMLLLDQLAYDENIDASNQDVKHYLNLIKRPRTKEFIYFDPPITKLRGQEVLFTSQELKQACLREKTLNHMIYHLTKA